MIATFGDPVEAEVQYFHEYNDVDVCYTEQLTRRVRDFYQYRI